MNKTIRSNLLAATKLFQLGITLPLINLTLKKNPCATLVNLKILQKHQNFKYP